MRAAYCLSVLALLAAAPAVAQNHTAPVAPGTNNCPSQPGIHNNMMPAVKPGEKSQPCPPTTKTPPAQQPSQQPSTEPQQQSPQSDQNNQPQAAMPDEGKPGLYPKDNQTNIHNPGSENPHDTSPGTPKG